MIIGIGTDILNLERFNKIINKYDQKFIDRIYGKNEIKISKSKLKNSLSSDRGDGLFFKEIEILNDINGRPCLFFSGKTKQFIEKKEKNLRAKLKFDISLSDDPPFVIAFVVISLAPYV